LIMSRSVLLTINASVKDCSENQTRILYPISFLKMWLYGIMCKNVTLPKTHLCQYYPWRSNDIVIVHHDIKMCNVLVYIYVYIFIYILRTQRTHTSTLMHIHKYRYVIYLENWGRILIQIYQTDKRHIS
jgi:hypothetical protein